MIFKAQNFRHLTGVATGLKAKEFYRFAAQGKLKVDHIWFDSVHTYDLCERKAKHLNHIAKMIGSENLILEEIVTDKKVFKFGTTDLKFTICLDREYDENGNVIGDCYVAQSLRDEDCFSRSRAVYEVTHILMKPNDQKLYGLATFIDKRFQLADVTDQVKELLMDEVQINQPMLS